MADKKDTRFSKLEVGQEVLLDTSDLPRIVEMIPAKGEEGQEGYEAAHEGEISNVTPTKPITVTLVVVDGGVGKQIGVQLPEPPKDHRWYDAHECDGEGKKGYCWWVTLDDIEQANPDLFKDEE